MFLRGEDKFSRSFSNRLGFVIPESLRQTSIPKGNRSLWIVPLHCDVRSVFDHSAEALFAFAHRGRGELSLEMRADHVSQRIKDATLLRKKRAFSRRGPFCRVSDLDKAFAAAGFK